MISDCRWCLDLRGRVGTNDGFLRFILHFFFNFLADPALNSDFSGNGLGFRKPIVNRDTEGVERDFAFVITLGAGNFSATQTTGATDFDTKSTLVHRELHSALHCAAEGNTALKLGGDILGYELSVEVGILDFDDVDLHLLAAGEITDFLGEVLDFLATATNHDTRTGGVDCHSDAIPSALDHYL